MGRADGLYSLILLLVGAAYLFEASKLPLWKVTTLGSGLFPLILGVAMVAVSGLLLIWGRVRGNRETPPEEESFLPRSGIAGQARVIGSLAAYILVLERVGFLLATFAFLSILLVALEPRRKASSVAVAALLVACSYLFLVVLLRMQLPRGLLG